jgi:hypothetical protein
VLVVVRNALKSIVGRRSAGKRSLCYLKYGTLWGRRKDIDRSCPTFPTLSGSYPTLNLLDILRHYPTLSDIIPSKNGPLSGRDLAMMLGRRLAAQTPSSRARRLYESVRPPTTVGSTPDGRCLAMHATAPTSGFRCNRPSASVEMTGSCQRVCRFPKSDHPPSVAHYDVVPCSFSSSRPTDRPRQVRKMGFMSSRCQRHVSAMSTPCQRDVTAIEGYDHATACCCPS